MSAPATGWVIGVDFDNTIAGYDELMHAIALERGLICANMAKNKKLIRDAIRALPDGETHWRGLQVTVYGPRMNEAQPLDGVIDFFRRVQSRRIPAYIVSHKTEYANFGEAGVNLRTAAMEWLEGTGSIMTPGRACAGRMFFLSRREPKKSTGSGRCGLRTLSMTWRRHFLEPSFPRQSKKFSLRRTAGQIMYRVWFLLPLGSKYYRTFLAMHLRPAKADCAWI
jgi:hypothetical protein